MNALIDKYLTFVLCIICLMSALFVYGANNNELVMIVVGSIVTLLTGPKQ